MRRVLQLPALIIACWAATSPQASLIYRSDAWGFAITRPSEAWACHSADGGTGALFTLSIYPRGSSGLPGVVVYVAKRDATSGPDAVRDRVAEGLGSGATSATRGVATVAGERAFTLSADVPAAAVPRHRLVIAYVAHGTLLYAVQTACAVDDVASPPLIDAMVASLALFPAKMAEEGTPEALLRSQADRCGSAVAWAPSWEAAASRARAGSRLVFVHHEYYSVIEVPSTFASGPLSDPDLVALINERFVMLKMGPGVPAPFRDAARFGMSEHAWGGAVLIVTPDGDVLRNTAIATPAVLWDVAASAIGEGFAASRPVATSRAGHSLAACRQRATAARLQRRGADALAAIKEARAAGGAAAVAADLDVEEATILMRMGRAAEAEAAFRRVVEQYPTSPRVPEALFWSGALAWERAGEKAGRPLLEALAAQHAESPWAWKAAANLTGRGAFVNGVEPSAWPSAETFALARMKSVRPAAPRGAVTRVECERAEHDAVAFLLRTQLADGSWLSPMEEPAVTGEGYHQATAALAGASLLRFSDRPDVRRTVERAQRHVLDAHVAARLVPLPRASEVYAIWARTFTLRFLAQSLTAKFGPRAELLRAGQELTDSILARQVSNGGWPYVSVAQDPAGGGLAASFLSACVLLTLLDARDAGLRIPNVANERASGFLRGLQNTDGTFRYMPDVPAGGKSGSDPEAAGRSPLCALALHRAAVGGVEGVRRALELFARDRGPLRDQRGKDLCHTGPDAQASYYFLYDLYFAAAATAVLPTAERAAYETIVRGEIMAARSSDGTVIDMPSLGNAYGTAMALATLGLVR